MDADEYLDRLTAWLATDRDGAERVHQAILQDDYPGALALVEELQGLGLFTCCFSNTNGLHWPTLSSPIHHPAVGNLNRRFTSHELRKAKPEPESYQEVESGMPPHGTVVFFDDGLENVIGASDAGWQAFRIDPHDDPVNQMRTTLKGLAVLGG
jgi:FMN phosphatase YigB (HAD superfamily)